MLTRTEEKRDVDEEDVEDGDDSVYEECWR